MLGTPPTVMSTANANAALAGPICDAIRVTSWLPMNVCGTKESRNALCRFKFQSSSKKFSDFPAELSTLGEPTYRLHQALIALRRRNPWLLDARTEAVKLENKHFVYRSTSADAQHSLTVDLNIEQSPTFTIRNADGSTAYQY